MTTMKRIIIGGCAAAAVLGTGLVAGSASGGSAAPAPDNPPVAGQTVTTLHSYELGTSARDAVEFDDNELILEGTVAGPPGRPRKVRRVFPDDTKLQYHYTPIPVRVTNVRKGTGIRAGQIVQMRALGGTAADATTVSSIGPAASAFPSGQRLVLFAQPVLDAGDGLSATTANFTFVRDPKTGTVRSLSHDGLGTPTRADTFNKLLATAR